MITPFKKGLISAAFIGTVLVPALPASAQTMTTVAPVYCTTFNYNLYYGMRSNDVVMLQSFLATQGYFPYSPIGTFGPLTVRAVQNFQSAHGISPTGYVGPITRGVINSRNCGQPIPPPVPPVPPAQSPSIQSLYPSSGPVGTKVTLYGYGFTNNSTVYFDNTSAGNVYSSNGTSISFTVPEYTSPCPPGAYCIMMAKQVTPGVYPIYVQNPNGTSNTVNFTVTASPSSQPVSITGIDAPASLRVGQMGTWTVRTNVPNYVSGSNIRYSVKWGDELISPYTASSAASQSIQTSATFTHSYNAPGIYYPVFTVTSDTNKEVSVTATVVVTY